MEIDIAHGDGKQRVPQNAGRSGGTPARKSSWLGALFARGMRQDCHELPRTDDGRIDVR